MQIASLESQSNDCQTVWCRWLQKCFENRRNNWGPWPPPLNPLLGLLQLGAVQNLLFQKISILPSLKGLEKCIEKMQCNPDCTIQQEERKNLVKLGIFCKLTPDNCDRKNYMLRLLDLHRYTGNLIEPNVAKPGFCSIKFTTTFVMTQNVDR